MKKLISLFFLLTAFSVSGCAAIIIGAGLTYVTAPLAGTSAMYLLPASEWTRIPEAPEYTVEEPIPLRVGIILNDSKIYSPYELEIIKEWEKIRLFDSMVFPYQDGDPIDAVMRLTTAGGWEDEGKLSRFGVNMLTGLTLGLSKPIVGRSATFTHDAFAVIHQSSDEIGRFSVEVSSTVRWEAGEDYGSRGPLGGFTPSPEHGRKGSSLDAGYELQGKRLAFELAKMIRADRQNLLSKLGTSQEETTTP